MLNFLFVSLQCWEAIQIVSLQNWTSPGCALVPMEQHCLSPSRHEYCEIPNKWTGPGEQKQSSAVPINWGWLSGRKQGKAWWMTCQSSESFSAWNTCFDQVHSLLLRGDLHIMADEASRESLFLDFSKNFENLKNGRGTASSTKYKTLSFPFERTGRTGFSYLYFNVELFWHLWIVWPKLALALQNHHSWQILTNSCILQTLSLSNRLSQTTSTDVFVMLVKELNKHSRIPFEICFKLLHTTHQAFPWSCWRGKQTFGCRGWGNYRPVSSIVALEKRRRAFGCWGQCNCRPMLHSNLSNTQMDHCWSTTMAVEASVSFLLSIIWIWTWWWCFVCH